MSTDQKEVAESLAELKKMRLNQVVEEETAIKKVARLEAELKAKVSQEEALKQAAFQALSDKTRYLNQVVEGHEHAFAGLNHEVGRYIAMTENYQTTLETTLEVVKQNQSIKESKRSIFSNLRYIVIIAILGFTMYHFDKRINKQEQSFYFLYDNLGKEIRVNNQEYDKKISDLKAGLDKRINDHIEYTHPIDETYTGSTTPKKIKTISPKIEELKKPTFIKKERAITDDPLGGLEMKND